MDNLEKLETVRQEIHIKYKKEMLYAILLIIPTALFILLGFLVSLVLLIGALIFGIPMLVFFSKAEKLRKKFRYTIKNDLVLTLLKEQFDDVEYNHETHIPIGRIAATKMVKRPDRSHAEDYIKGTYKDVIFEVSDIDLKERVVRSNGKTTYVTYETYFKGRWIIYQFEKSFADELRIIEGRRITFSKKNLEKIETESITFNKKFDIYATSKKYGFYHITSSMIEKLLELEKMHRGTILYYFTKNELHIGINDRKDYMEVSLNKPINRESLKSFIADIEVIPAIINELRLNSTKFKN